MLNHCTFIGHLGKDPEIRDVGSSRVANFSIACTEKWKTKDGEAKERTEWVNCVAWGPLAGIIEKYLRKGSKVYIAGRMETHSYEKDGVKRYSTEINVSVMKMLDGPRTQDGQQDQPAEAPVQTDGPEDSIPF